MHILSRNESIYERYSNKTKCMYFMIKDEKFIVDFEHISHHVLVFLLLTLNK